MDEMLFVQRVELWSLPELECGAQACLCGCLCFALACIPDPGIWDNAPCSVF
jgi:hypothetical protein